MTSEIEENYQRWKKYEHLDLDISRYRRFELSESGKWDALHFLEAFVVGLKNVLTDKMGPEKGLEMIDKIYLELSTLNGAFTFDKMKEDMSKLVREMQTKKDSDE